MSIFPKTMTAKTKKSRAVKPAARSGARTRSVPANFSRRRTLKILFHEEKPQTIRLRIRPVSERKPPTCVSLPRSPD